MKKKTFKISLLLITISIFISGCNSDSKEYKEFKKEYNSKYYFYCDKNTGFLMKQLFWNKYDRVLVTRLIKNDLDQPIRCGESTITTIETSEGTNRW